MGQARYDVVIRDATIVDGTGTPGHTGDVAILDDRIAVVGRVAPEEALTVLDANGLTLSPGFIDVHAHDDFAVFLYAEMACKVLQGVTTTIVGNCGFGAAPFPAAGLFQRAFHPGEEVEPWDGYRGYFERLDSDPPSLNVGALVGHGTLRLTAMGNAARPPSDGELERMGADLDEGLEAGALGLSSGLVYEPGRHATTAELVTLSSRMQGTGALYATHMRDEGGGLLDSVAEAIEIGERAGVPVQISHHKASGRRNWGRVRESLGLIETARARGVDVTADQYPYTAASTILAAIVQNDALGDGGRMGSLEPHEVVIASTPTHPEWEGSSLEELARRFGVEASEAARRVLDAEGSATVVLHLMDEQDVQTVLRHPSTMIGSDGLPTLRGRPHPRLYGTFPRVLGRYARELGVLSLEQAVHRMTGLPAAKFGLRDRGTVREGAFADLVLFDPGTIEDLATYDDPHRSPRGIARVFVNGAQVACDGEHTGARPGRALRRP